MSEVTPPGWYPDPDGQMRWWDGNGWTESVQTEGQTPGAAFGAAPGTAGPGSRKSLWIGLGVGAALLAIGGVVLALVLGGGSDSGPEAAAKAYVSAMEDQDGDAFCDLSYFEDDAQKQACTEHASTMWEALDGVDIGKVEVKSSDEQGDEATVVLSVTATKGGESRTEETTMSLKKVDGDWLVSDFD